MIQHMKGGVGGKLGWMELCVIQVTTVDILFKRGGGHQIYDVIGQAIKALIYSLATLP